MHPHEQTLTYKKEEKKKLDSKQRQLDFPNYTNIHVNVCTTAMHTYSMKGGRRHGPINKQLSMRRKTIKSGCISISMHD